MKPSPKIYLACLGGCVATGVLGSIAWNAGVDPYGIYREHTVQGFNHYRFVAGQSAERMMKAHALNRDTAPGLLLGTSRVDWGLSPETAARFSGLSGYYNAGLGGCTIYEAFRYLQHANHQHPRSHVVLGLDIEMFNTTLARDPGLDQRLAVTPSGERNFIYGWQDWIPTLYSLSAFKASRKTIKKSRQHAALSRHELEVRGGAYQESLIPPEKRPQAFRERQEEARENFRLLAQQQRLIDLRLDWFSALVAYAHRENIQLHLFITPYHDALIQLLHTSGNGPVFLDWLESLHRCNEEIAARHGREPFPLWDFSVPHPITRDPPPTDNRRMMQYYMECSHYRKITGDLVLARIFNSAATADGFGMPIQQSIPLHRQAIDVTPGRKRTAEAHGKH